MKGQSGADRRLCRCGLLVSLSLAALSACNSESNSEGRANDAVLLLNTEESTTASIHHPSLDAHWVIRLPEVVGTAAALLFYPAEDGQNPVWKDHGDGWIGYAWKPPISDREASAKGAARAESRYTPDVAVAARMKTGLDRIDLVIKVTNLSHARLHNVWSDGGDLQHHTPRFIDKKYSRTYIKTSDGIIPLSSTDRTQGIRCTYVFNNDWYKTPVFLNDVSFWGRSGVIPTSAFIASEAEDGNGAVGIGYEQAFKLMQNSDGHNCMHSGPLFGTIEPGETKVRRGVILFGRSAAELFDRFESIGYEPVSRGPQSLVTAPR